MFLLGEINWNFDLFRGQFKLFLYLCSYMATFYACIEICISECSSGIGVSDVLTHFLSSTPQMDFYQYAGLQDHIKLSHWCFGN